ncbi:protein MULTIPLE CHLOROPLAST DIVISION SITE 1-like [Zingiber officinale]|uniref:protein MULTIPLE CHLOROPLAST DIVISION SITE 1-like n=1 Tax=Zingiber officinale TaxID=94328 RepID=UPI001C4D586E|nr:protein MULTIPLE CHLOROPLAST DIVISION SITE 1-like [Zingiber officinale]
MTVFATSTLPFQSIYPQGIFSDWVLARGQWSGLRMSYRKSSRVTAIRASAEVPDSGVHDDASAPAVRKEIELEKRVVSLREMVNAFPPVPVLKETSTSKVAIGLCISVAILAIARKIMLKQEDRSYQGSVADLVRRGQIRSDRRGFLKPMKYDDPFNNPYVKTDKSSSTVEMFGKVYRLAPVTLTAKEKSIHQKRRSRAYQWKRPTIFLKEDDSIPPDIDPDTVKWIPANHPFATTVSDIDEDLAQNNVYQKDGVPFRVKAEHEAMQKKLEALQNEQRVNEVSINLNSIDYFDQPVRSSKLQEQDFSNPQNDGSDSSSTNHHKN